LRTARFEEIVTASRAADEIRDLVLPLVDALGCRLYDLELSGSGRARTLRVLIDRDGGVDLDAITAATQAISAALDPSSAINGPFLLEVSSPGLERPLRRPGHFAGAIGETVTISSHTDSGPERRRGTLVDAGELACVVEIDGARVEIAYDSITKARTVFEWGPEPRPRDKTTKTRGRAKEKA
jgi:ribosome maturation factor RimP